MVVMCSIHCLQYLFMSSRFGFVTMKVCPDALFEIFILPKLTDRLPELALASGPIQPTARLICMHSLHDYSLTVLKPSNDILRTAVEVESLYNP